MKIYSSDDFADPHNPTPKELHLWLCADPTRGLSLFALEKKEFAKLKSTASPAEIRREAARLRKKSDAIARCVLNHIFDVMGNFQLSAPFPGSDVDATPKLMHLTLSLLDLARKYLPHVLMPERAKWRSLIKDTDLLRTDLLAELKSEITHQPLPPEIRRRCEEYSKVAESAPRKKPRPGRRNDP